MLCVDEKPSIQALERAHGYLKLPNGRALTGQSHDYKRHGTTTLFAALEVATGKIIATHSKRRRRVEFLDFMNSVTAAFPGRKLHVILDNLDTHQKNEHWLKGPPQCEISFHADKRVLAQSGRGMVLDLAGTVTQRHLLHKPQAASGTHRCLRQRVQRKSRSLRLDQEKGPPTPLHRPPYHLALIPGTSRPASAMKQDSRWQRSQATLPRIARPVVQQDRNEGNLLGNPHLEQIGRPPGEQPLCPTGRRRIRRSPGFARYVNKLIDQG